MISVSGLLESRFGNIQQYPFQIFYSEDIMHFDEDGWKK